MKKVKLFCCKPRIQDTLSGGKKMNQLKGLHHVTAITSSAEKIYDFFTHVLGLRLVKKQ